MVGAAAKVRQPVVFLLAAAAFGALLGLPVLRHAPNRLLTGRPLGLPALGLPGWIVMAAAAALLAVAFAPRSRWSSWVTLGSARARGGKRKRRRAAAGATAVPVR
jgi:osmoprotectant transport system permease protein